MSSLAGYRGLPKALIYGASKAALINFAEALYLDLEPRNIGVYLINPGFVKTPLTDRNEFRMPHLISAEEAARATIAGLEAGDVRDRISEALRAPARAAAPSSLSPLLRGRAPRHRTVNTLDTRAAVERVKAFYERMQSDDLDRLGEVYAPHAYFRDPFNEVRSLEEVRRVLAQMFVHLDDCRFVFHDTIVDGNGAMLTWDMTFRIRRLKPRELRSIHGATHLKFDAAGRVAYHRDYWDAADELYAKLPVIGALMRWLKRKMG